MANLADLDPVVVDPQEYDSTIICSRCNKEMVKTEEDFIFNPPINSPILTETTVVPNALVWKCEGCGLEKVSADTAYALSESIKSSLRI